MPFQADFQKIFPDARAPLKKRSVTTKRIASGTTTNARTNRCASFMLEKFEVTECGDQIFSLREKKQNRVPAVHDTHRVPAVHDTQQQCHKSVS